MKYSLALAILLAALTSSAKADLVINEFHYDDIGTDGNEFIEVVSTGGESLADISLVLYNGSDSSPYGSVLNSLSSGFSDHGILGDGNRYLSWSLPVNGLQNGSPDGFALVLGGSVVEFLSYEGTISATSGIASGMTSLDIGLLETNATLELSSIQRDGLGSTWFQTSGFNTQGAINAVPEPSSFALLSLFGMGVVGYRRRRVA